MESSGVSTRDRARDRALNRQEARAMKQVVTSVVVGAICLAVGVVIGRRLGGDRASPSDTLRSSLKGYVTDEGTARRALGRYLAVKGSRAGSRKLSDFDVRVEPLGKSTWVIYAKYKHASPRFTHLYLADTEGVRPATLQNLEYAHRREFPRSFDKKTHERIMDSMIRLHTSAPHGRPAKIIASTRDIPGYDNKPLDADLEGVIRSPWSFKNEQGDILYVVCTYNRECGIVCRYKFGFRSGGVGLYRTEHVELGRRIGDAIVRQ